MPADQATLDGTQPEPQEKDPRDEVLASLRAELDQLRERVEQPTAAPELDEEAQATLQELTIAQKAQEVREADTDYRTSGRLSRALLAKLEPLLRERIPARYIKHLGATTGKPYESTGISSSQVQVDRMNDVLGLSGWRYLCHYADGGMLCKVVVVVGNDLEWCRLDEKGELVPWTLAGDAVQRAEVFTVREGYGGHGRGSGKGDVWKGSETNALKRTLARVGPGCEVYRLDFEDHPEMPAASAQQTAQPAGRAQQEHRNNNAAAQGVDVPPQGAPVPGGDGGTVVPTEPDWNAELEGWLKKKDKAAGLRKTCVEGMQHLGAGTRQIVTELVNNPTEAKLRELMTRINAALNVAAGEDTPS